jgi:hypothetical protein
VRLVAQSLGKWQISCREEINRSSDRPLRGDVPCAGSRRSPRASCRSSRLAGEGLSNRDISDALFVSLKMVEQYLARADVKLVIGGRMELSAALRGMSCRAWMRSAAGRERAQRPPSAATTGAIAFMNAAPTIT